MFRPTYATALAAGLLMAASAHAQIAVTADAGTTGVGAHLVVPMESNLNGRFGANYFKHNSDDKDGGNNYALKTKLQTVDVLFDYFPMAGSPFRVTAGGLYNGNTVSAKAKTDAAGNYTINGKTYAAATVGTLTAGVDYQKFAPYIGIGWGTPIKAASAWSFTADLGAFYQGKPNTSLVSIGCTVSNAACAALATDVAAEKASFTSDISKYKVYPVARVGMAYRF
jgi:hypothetical protein